MLRRDLRDAIRSLRRAPGFVITVVLILGIGIGMTSAMFTVFENVALRDLPMRDQDRLITLAGMGRGAAAREFPILVPPFKNFQTETRTLAGVAGYAHWSPYPFPIRDGEIPLDLKESAVTANFFDVLGLEPVLGRTFRPEDEREWGIRTATSGEYYAIISYGTWQRVFHGDRGIIGHRLNNPVSKWEPVIIGVAPPGADFPRGTDYWVPVPYPGLDLAGRLAPGSSLATAREEYAAFLGRIPDLKALGPQGVGAQAAPLADAILGDVRGPLVVLTAAVGLLLALTCVNVGNLLLLRAAERNRELAVRRALGAGSGALVRTLLAENIVLGIAGGTLGLVFTRLLLGALPHLAPDGLPRMDAIASAGAPVLVESAVTFLAILFFGLVPALGALRTDLASPLRSDTRGGTEGRRLRRIRHVLVGSQVALALLVLAGAGLLVRSFTRLVGLDTGYVAANLSIIQFAPPFERYVRECGGQPPRSDSVATARFDHCNDALLNGFHERAEEVLAGVPGVVSASTVQITPFVGPSVFMTKIQADGQSATEAQGNPFFAIESIGADFFRTFEIPVLRGRAFTPADRAGAPLVAIVTEGVARVLWPGQDALGRRFHQVGGAAANPDSAITIVGITPDINYREHRVATPTIYVPFRQGFPQGTLAVRTRGRLADVLPAMRAAVSRIDPATTITKAQTMDELVAPQLAKPRLQALLLSLFACAALTLAAVGLYGIMARVVTQQRRELGVRMALGATATEMRKMILRQALTIAGLGAVCGLAGALVGSRLLSSMLFEVSPTDPVTMVGVSLLLLGVALVAAYLPARRATKIDPAVALRAE